MADPLDLVPLRQESIESIRARINADANAGLTPDDDGYIDLTPGGFWWDLTQGPALEMERLWDFATHEVPAAIFLIYSYGEYLDDHGEALGVARKDEAKATGRVRFSGTDGTAITTGAQVAAPTTDPEADPREYQVVEGGTIAGGFVDLDVIAMDAGAAGNSPASSLTLLMTPIDGVTAVTNQQAVSGGADVEEDDAYKERLLLEMSGQGGGGTRSQLIRWALEVAGIGAATVQPLIAGPGTARVMVRDTENSPVSALKVEEVQAHIDPPVADTLSNGVQSLPPAGGVFTVDSTAEFRVASVAVPQRFYVLGQVITCTGMTATTFTGCTGGTGSIPDNSPVYQGGMGLGKANIGHDIIVGTPTQLNVTVVATIAFEAGYSLDGAGGTIATRADIEAAVRDYVDTLDVGEDVIRNHVEARMFRIRGVYDVTTSTINGAGANLAVSNDQVARLTTITLT